MKALGKGLMTIALVAATAACDSSPTESTAAFAPEREGIAMAQAPRGSLTFSSTQSYDTQAEQTATGGPGSISFTGSVTTGTPCVEVSASHNTRRNTVTLTVSATNTGGFCTQLITYNNYTGAITGLEPGTYTFNVVHSTSGGSTTAYSSTVVVQ